jgi:hypothetical protein
MMQLVPIALPAELQLALEEASRSEGVSRDELVTRAVKQHLFLRRFHSLRERLATKNDQGADLTDQDVFDAVS